MLESIFNTEKHPYIRCRALSILRRIDDDRVVPLMGKVARTDEDYRVRKQAIYYLGKSNDDRALDILKSILDE